MNAVYSTAKQKFLEGEINLLTDPVVAYLVGTSAYTYSAAHATLLDLPASARIAVSGTLANRSTTNGVFDADDISFGTVTGSRIDAIVLAVKTGVEATSHLIAYLNETPGLPIEPMGRSISVQWSNGNTKIFVI